MLMLSLSLLISTTLAGEPIIETMKSYLEHASLPIPLPTPAQLEKLNAGEVAKVRISGGPGASDGAMVLRVTELSRQALWLGSADSHGEETNLIDHHLPKRGDEMFRWYGLVDLPRPFADRHFLIRTIVNTALPAALPGMWERSWSLEPGGQETMRGLVAAGQVDGVSTEMFDAAIYTPTNHGAWLFLELPDGRTLFGYHAATSLGGEIPDGMVTRYVFWGLDEIVRTVFMRAKEIESHYRDGHPTITGGDGRPIPLFP
jgi:hypothetical protein